MKSANPVLNQFRAILIYYRGVFPAALILSMVCCVFSVMAASSLIRHHEPYYGIIMFIAPAFWTKLLTDFALLAYLHVLKEHELTFYQNLGLGRTELWTALLMLDFLLFFLLFFLAGNLPPLIAGT